MYKNMSKKVEELVEELKRKGMYSEYESMDTFVCDDDLVYFDRACSDDVLDRCIAIVRDAADAKDAWARLTDSGLLNCEPVLVNNSIVFGYQKYMHWFREYYYQTSYTINGRGSREHTYFRMDYALCGLHKHEQVCQVLTAAALATALRYYKQTTKMLATKEGIDALNGLIRHDLHEHYKWAECESCSIHNLLGFITVMTSKYPIDEPVGDNTKVIQLDGKGALYLSKSVIRVVTRERGLYVLRTLTVPKWVWEEDEDDDFLCWEDKRPNSIMKLFVEFMIAYAGVRLGVTGIFSMVDKNSVVKVNSPCVAHNIEDVYDVVSDYYKD